MAFSLSNWFKGKPGAPGSESDEAQSAPPQAAPAPSAPPPPSVRTAMPSGSTPPPAPVSLRSPGPRPTVTVSPAKLPVSSKITPSLPTMRKVAFPSGAPSAPAPAMPSPMRPSSAPAAPAPDAPEMTVSLEIGDFIDRLPPAFLRPGAVDRRKPVDFQASELYSDLSKGRASVPASVIYQRCPELFSRPISETEDVEVPLPLRKLVEQMGTALSTRTDQLEEENVGQIETPFLQVALEDNARLPTAHGSAAGAVRPVSTPASATNGSAAPTRPHRTGQISTISPVKAPPEQPPMAPPTAATSGPIIPGKRPPSTVRASVAGGKIRLSGPAVVNRMAPVPNPDDPASPGEGKPRPGTHSQRIHLPVAQPASPSHQVAKKTARIQIPPISLRTGGPNATPRTGPTPPTAGSSAPAVGKEPPSPPPISFRTSPPPPSAKPMPSSFAPPRGPAFPPPSFPAVPPAPAAVEAVAPAAPDDRKIELGLAAILRSLPSSMLSVEPSSVPDDVRISLPFAVIEPQLSLGRASIRREVFVQALPEMHRQVFADETEPADVPLPLQEVFQHLPTNALTIRADQLAEETGAHYPTPFSQKADEDAQRFTPSKPAPPVEDKVPTPEPAPEPPRDEAEADTVTDLPLGQVEDTPAPAAEAAAPAEAVHDVPIDETETSAPAAVAEEPTRDIPLDESEPAAPVTEAEPPLAELAPEPPHDILLDHDDVSSVETAPAPSVVEEEPVPAAEMPAPEAEAVAETPVEAVLPAAPVESLPETPAPPADVAEPAALENHDAAPALAPEPPAAAAADRPLPVAHDSVLQTLFMTEEELDAKSIVKLVCQLPGVHGCAMMFEDGLRLAGNFPEGDSNGFSAMSAPFFKRAERFVSELELGHLQSFTLHTEHGLLSFFMHDAICVGIHHTGRGFLPGVREKLEIVTREVARMYTTAKTPPNAE